MVFSQIPELQARRRPCAAGVSPRTGVGTEAAGAVTQKEGGWQDAATPPPENPRALVPGAAADKSGHRTESSAEQSQTRLHWSHPFLTSSLDSPGPETGTDRI